MDFSWIYGFKNEKSPIKSDFFHIMVEARGIEPHVILCFLDVGITAKIV
jgi:hypothetical protein